MKFYVGLLKLGVVGVLFFGALPNAGASEVLTFDVALKKAEQANTQLVSASESVNAASYKAAQARAGYLPQLNFSATYTRATSNFTPRPGLSSLRTNLPPESNTSFNFYSAALSANQTLYDFGRTGNSFDAAKLDARATEFELESTKDQIYLNVTQNYFGVLANQEALAAALETRRQMAKHLELAHGQVGAGVRPMIDVARAKADLANSELAVLQAQNQLAVAKSSLNLVMGEREGRTDFAVTKPTLPLVSTELTLQVAIEKALAQRADLRASRERVAAQAQTVKLARSGYYPSLVASGNIAYAGTDIQDLVYNWTGAVTLNWNFFSGLATVSASGEAAARLRASQSNLQGLELSIRNEVEVAYLALQEANEKQLPVSAALLAAQETLSLAEGRYAAGAGSIVEVTDAQALYTQAKVAQIAAEFELAVAGARLKKVMGTIREGE